MLQMRWDKSQPGGGNRESLVRVGTSEGNTPIEEVSKTAQKVAQRLEGQGFPIDPEQEDQDEEETGEKI